MGSFNINIDTIMTYAASIFNALMPIAAFGIGLTLGIGILGLMARVVKSAVSGL